MTLILSQPATKAASKNFLQCNQNDVNFRFGPMWVVGATGFTSGVLNCLTPASAYFDFWLLFTVRILIGFCAVRNYSYLIICTGGKTYLAESVWAPPQCQLFFRKAVATCITVFRFEEKCSSVCVR